jgi:SAM-dependent methyltransferase
MSRLGEFLILALNRIVPMVPTHRSLDLAKQDVDDYQRWEYLEVKRLYRDFGHHWDLCDKYVLDVGCGLGGKPLFYAEQGAASVIAVDIRLDSAQAALELARERGRDDMIHVFVADGTCLPFASGEFDIIISINVFEHVHDPLAMLAECKRVLRPDGLILLHFPPFYSPWGAHLEGWLHFPWPHLLFSDKTLIGAVKRIEAKRRLNTKYIPTARMDWSALNGLPGLNRLTVRRFKAMIRALDLQQVECRLLPFGRHYLLDRGAVAQGLLRVLYWLARKPGLCEVITTKMVYVLTKAPDGA